MSTRSPSGYARYIGRVGGLAVALGIGVAIADNAGAALADDSAAAKPAASSESTTKPDNAKRTLKRSLGDFRDRIERSPKTDLSERVSARRTEIRDTVRGLGSSHRDNDPGKPPQLLRAVVTQARPATPVRNRPATADGVGLVTVLGAARQERIDASQAAPVPDVPATQTPRTDDQLAAEQRATRIAKSPAVVLAKVVLKVAWYNSAQKNFTLVGGPDQANLAQLDRSVDEYANQAAMEVQLLDPNNPKILQQVMPPHTWYGQSVGGTRIWYDNPDTVYRFVAVNAASEYVITGTFDKDHMPADTNFSVLTGLNGDTASNLNADDLELDEDGTFRITVSSRQPEPGEDHLYLPPDATLITTRNTLSDWDDQVPMSVSIERVSGPPDSLFAQVGGFLFPGIGPAVTQNPTLVKLVSVIPPFKNPPVALQATETALLMLILGISKQDEYMAVATTDPQTGELRQPNTLSEPSYNAQFLATQLQSTGYFDLADDEALVITIDQGSAKYFNVPVTNDWTITDNYWDQQTSLNNAQATPDDNVGTYTIVVAKNDPGMANWVSTGGLNQGTLSIRFQGVADPIGDPPTVHAEVIKIPMATSV